MRQVRDYATPGNEGSRTGTVNLMGCGRNDARDEAGHTTPLCQSGNAGDLGPGLKGLGPGGSVLGGRAVIAAEVEQIVDPVMGEEEALGLADQCEPLDRPFSYDLRLISSR